MMKQHNKNDKLEEMERERQMNTQMILDKLKDGEIRKKKLEVNNK